MLKGIALRDDGGRGPGRPRPGNRLNASQLTDGDNTFWRHAVQLTPVSPIIWATPNRPGSRGI